MGLLLSAQANGIEIGRILSVSTALPDANKNLNVTKSYESDFAGGIAPISQKRRNQLTDANRVTAARSFIEGDSDWIFWLDDDTVPPEGTIEMLLRAQRAVIGGVYFLGGHPHNPIAYYKLEDGTYAAMLDYPPGTFVEVDALGMGCTLIHRSVYETIMANYTVFQRPNGSLYPVHKDDIIGSKKKLGKKKHPHGYVQDGFLVQPVHERHPDDKRPFPFYALEYGRTEDFHFCEMVKRCGFPIYLDTNIVCDHWKLMSVNLDSHKSAMKRWRRERAEEVEKDEQT